MDAYSHGGHCCGMSHIQGFNIIYQDRNYPRKRVAERHNMIAVRLDYLLDDSHRFRGCKTLVEVTLTSGQNKVWSNALLNRGFKLVNSFHNGNSGNNVYIYHKNPPVIPSAETDLPYIQHEELLDKPEVVGDWQEPTQVEQPPQPTTC